MAIKAFNTKRPVDLPNSDNDSRTMTLAEHILSSHPHPNMSSSGGGSSDDFSAHIQRRSIDDSGNVGNPPHLDINGLQLFAGRTHNHDTVYSKVDHNHSDLIELISDIQNTISSISSINSSSSSVFNLSQPKSTDTTRTDGKLTSRTYDLNDQILGNIYLFVGGEVETYNKYDATGDTFTVTPVEIINAPQDAVCPFIMQVYPGYVRKSESSNSGHPDSSIHRIVQMITDFNGNKWSRFGLADVNQIEEITSVSSMSFVIPPVINLDDNPGASEDVANCVSYLSDNTIPGTYVYNSVSHKFVNTENSNIAIILDLNQSIGYLVLNVVSDDQILISATTNIEYSSELNDNWQSILANITDLYALIKTSFVNINWFMDETPIPSEVFDVETYSTYSYIDADTFTTYEAMAYQYSNWNKVQ